MILHSINVIARVQQKKISSPNIFIQSKLKLPKDLSVKSIKYSVRNRTDTEITSQGSKSFQCMKQPTQTSYSSIVYSLIPSPTQQIQALKYHTYSCPQKLTTRTLCSAAFNRHSTRPPKIRAKGLYFWRHVAYVGETPPPRLFHPPFLEPARSLLFLLFFEDLSLIWADCTELQIVKFFCLGYG